MQASSQAAAASRAATAARAAHTASQAWPPHPSTAGGEQAAPASLSELTAASVLPRPPLPQSPSAATATPPAAAEVPRAPRSPGAAAAELPASSASGALSASDTAAVVHIPRPAQAGLEGSLVQTRSALHRIDNGTDGHSMQADSGRKPKPPKQASADVPAPAFGLLPTSSVPPSLSRSPVPPPRAGIGRFGPVFKEPERSVAELQAVAQLLLVTERLQAGEHNATQTGAPAADSGVSGSMPQSAGAAAASAQQHMPARSRRAAKSKAEPRVKAQQSQDTRQGHPSPAVDVHDAESPPRGAQQTVTTSTQAYTALPVGQVSSATPACLTLPPGHAFRMC